MGLLEANAHGLRSLAAQCRCLGAELGGGVVPAVVSSEFQATVDAVSTAHVGVALAASSLTARLEDTANALEDAGAGFLVEDHHCALTIRDLVAEA